MTAELSLSINDASSVKDDHEVMTSHCDTSSVFTELLIMNNNHNDNDSVVEAEIGCEFKKWVTETSVSDSFENVDVKVNEKNGTCSTEQKEEDTAVDGKEEEATIDRNTVISTSSSAENSIELNEQSHHSYLIDTSTFVTKTTELLPTISTESTVGEASNFNKTGNTTDLVTHDLKGPIIEGEKMLSDEPRSFKLVPPPSSRRQSMSSSPPTPEEQIIEGLPAWNSTSSTPDEQTNALSNTTATFNKALATPDDHSTAGVPPLSSSSLNIITQQVLNKIGETSVVQQHAQATANGSINDAVQASLVLKRFIQLELVEDEKHVEKPHKRQGSILSSFALRYRPRAGSLGSYDDVQQERSSKLNHHPLKKEAVAGMITVSWYAGTTTDELQEHVRKSIVRKLGKEVFNIRLLDYHPDDAEGFSEVVLSPHIPSGSKFIVKYTFAPPRKDTPVRTIYKYGETAPDSPSAALTPSPSISNNLYLYNGSTKRDFIDGPSIIKEESDALSPPPMLPMTNGTDSNCGSIGMIASIPDASTVRSSATSVDKEKVVVVQATQTQIKKHVIFMLANYFVLFLSIIAISAELHERAPKWMNEQLSQVQACAVDRDTLFECVSNGNISGLIASIALWLSKSKLTSRIFLFGFRTRNELWTVVYECFVTSFCWGFSYCFIRRGLNPDTRQNFLSKYWKDTVYGSLAGFNAAFMKAVLKNLIPKEAVEEVFKETPQLSIVSIIGRLLGLPTK